MKRNLCPPEEREKSAASSAPKCTSGTSLNVLRITLKALEAGSDPYLGFLDFRNTPTEGLGTSPAQCLFGRCTKTLLPTAGRLLTQPEFDTTSQLLHAQKNKQAFCYDNGTKELQPLEPGSTVLIHPPKYSHQWTQATVDKQVGVRPYQVITDDGGVYRRNHRHPRLTAEVNNTITS